ncbi:MAG: tRNA (N6-isopentenyl adenosine(37)-C2)-methylthiotransferase MiaB [Candidatus Latescibacteria bacterium]|nr:tRNA (N6-isopentenyl adenosine(37)-C2)-methylthiotransferase MiaB [Candidatus Latescibacterota bacterium]
MKPEKIYIETYGCQMNKLDSEYVNAILTEDGFTVVTDPDDADVILLNTCGVRDNAEQRIHGRVGELSSLRRFKPDLIFGIIGCMAQRLGNNLISDVVSIVAGPDTYRLLPSMIEKALYEKTSFTDLHRDETYSGIEPVRVCSHSAWVAVMRGCNNYCSYCIVPYTRGSERSIPCDDILAEIENLKQNGYREVTLLGQNVNSYNDGEINFTRLLERIAQTGIEWIRFLTSHPKDLSVDILDVMSKNDNICNHLHLPLQSGSDRILKAMNRKYTISRYLSLIESARKFIPGINISTDIIFGFPDETEEDYRNTLSVMQSVRFDFAFLYRYSEREGTKAALFPNKVPEQVRLDRLREAIELQNSIIRQKNRERIGATYVVLIKGLSKDKQGWYGFTETNIPVVVKSKDGASRIGSFVNVHIEDSTGGSLVGTAI